VQVRGHPLVEGAMPMCDKHAVKLTGDEAGVAALKSMHAKDGGASTKFIVEEARTNTDHKAEFRAEDGTLYELVLDMRSGDLVISRAENQRASKLPGPI
jgi:hypothetical protein